MDDSLTASVLSVQRRGADGTRKIEVSHTRVTMRVVVGGQRRVIHSGVGCGGRGMNEESRNAGNAAREAAGECSRRRGSGVLERARKLGEERERSRVSGLASCFPAFLLSSLNDAAANPSTRKRPGRVTGPWRALRVGAGAPAVPSARSGLRAGDRCASRSSWRGAPWRAPGGSRRGWRGGRGSRRPRGRSAGLRSRA